MLSFLVAGGYSIIGRNRGRTGGAKVLPEVLGRLGAAPGAMVEWQEVDERGCKRSSS